MKFFKNILSIIMMVCLFGMPQINHAAPSTLDNTQEIINALFGEGYTVVMGRTGETVEVDLPLPPEVAPVTVQVLNDRGNAIFTHRGGGVISIIPDAVLASGEGLALVVVQAGFIIIANNIPT